MRVFEVKSSPFIFHAWKEIGSRISNLSGIVQNDTQFPEYYQYVDEFPLPNPAQESSKHLVALAKQFYELPDELDGYHHLDSQVWRAFGLSAEEVMG